MGTLLYRINGIVQILTIFVSNLIIVYIGIKIIFPILNNCKNLTWEQIKEKLIQEVGADNIFKMSKKDIYIRAKQYIKIKRRPLNLCKIVLILLFIISFCILRSTSNMQMEYYMSHYWILGGIIKGVVIGSAITMLIYAAFLLLIVISDFKDNKNTIFIKRNIKRNIFDVYIKEDYIDL